MLVPIIEGNKGVLAVFIYHNVSHCLSSSFIPTGLKYADVGPVFKKDEQTDKGNYGIIVIF